MATTPCSSVWSKRSRSEAEERDQADARTLRKDRRRHSSDADSERVSPCQLQTTARNVGDKILVDQFADGDMIDVVGKSKGRGFAGTIKRHNFNRGPESHGSMNVRAPGSIGAVGVSVASYQGNAVVGSHG